MFHSKFGRNLRPARIVSYPMNTCGTTNPRWIEHPFRLISWWDMNEFSTAKLFELGRAFNTLEITLSRLDDPGHVITDEDRLPEFLRLVKYVLGLIHLSGPTAAVERLLARIKE